MQNGGIERFASAARHADAREPVGGPGQPSDTGLEGERYDGDRRYVRVADGTLDGIHDLQQLAGHADLKAFIGSPIGHRVGVNRMRGALEDDG